jgi:hypothetical protein
MKYIFALIVPPVGMFVVGRPYQATLCGLLFLASIITIPFAVGVFGWAVCSVWALIVVATTNAVEANLHTMHTLEQHPGTKTQTD